MPLTNTGEARSMQRLEHGGVALAYKRGGESAHVAVGDKVRTGENFHPHFYVIALNDDLAWIRDTQNGIDHVVPLDRCCRV